LDTYPPRTGHNRGHTPQRGFTHRIYPRLPTHLWTHPRITFGSVEAPLRRHSPSRSAAHLSQLSSSVGRGPRADPWPLQAHRPGSRRCRLNLLHRLVKLERLRPPPSCPGCGCPASARLRIVTAEHHDPMPNCKVCKRPLDDHGRPLHTPYTRIKIGVRLFTRSPRRSN